MHVLQPVQRHRSSVLLQVRLLYQVYRDVTQCTNYDVFSHGYHFYSCQWMFSPCNAHSNIYNAHSNTHTMHTPTHTYMYNAHSNTHAMHTPTHMQCTLQHSPFEIENTFCGRQAEYILKSIEGWDSSCGPLLPTGAVCCRLLRRYVKSLLYMLVVLVM